MRKLIQLFTVLITVLSVFGLYAQVTVVNDGILTVKQDQIVHINGDFSNYSSLFLNQGDIGLTGNFLNEARVTNPGIGIFRFIGLQEQTLTLFDTLDMFNVEMYNPAGLRLDGVRHLQIYGNMNFRDGIVETNSQSMLSFKDDASTSNGSYYSHIDGPALKSGENDFVFPLGKEGDYRPAAISALTDTGTYLMEYFHFPYFNYTQEFDVLKVNDEGFWDFQRVNGALSYPKLTVTYDEATNIFPNTSELEIVYWDDLWKIVPSDIDSTTNVIGLTTQNRVADFGYFTTAQRRRLIPVASSINITQNDCAIRVEWVMPPGTRVTNYEIEYSYDSLEFTYVGEVPGDTIALSGYRTYQFTDPNLHEVSKIYYRIKYVATGPWGAYTYSSVISIENQCVFEDCVLYPNPVSSNENIKFLITVSLDTKLPLQIWDALGRLMFEQILDLKAGRHVYEIKTKENRLVSGTYFIPINPRKSLKFIVITE